MGYFTFNGISSTNFGVLERITVRKRGKKTSEVLEIPGRAEPVLQQREQQESYTIDFVIGAKSREHLDAMYSSLSGAGKLVLSDDTGKYINAVCTGELAPERLGRRMLRTTISFTCAPFAYAVSNDPETLESSPAYIQTSGTYWSEPLIAVTGSGNITVTVNGTTLSVPNVSGTVYIDVPAKKVYTRSGNVKTLATSTGWIEDMIFVPSADAYNKIQWTGSVSAITVTKNERWV